MKELNETIEQVLSLRSLSPSPLVNTTMSRLVAAVVKADVLSGNTRSIERVRTVSAAAESAMERWWARKVIMARNSHSALATFPYQDNYAELVAREIALLKETGLAVHSGLRILVIGSGPLPLTAVELVRQTGASALTQVDSSRSATFLNWVFTKRLKLPGMVRRGYGETVRLKGPFDIVYVAALAGETVVEKQAIIDNCRLHLSHNGRILLRSAHGARELLYPAIAAHDIQGVAVLKEYHPHDHIINSVFIYGESNG